MQITLSCPIHSSYRVQQIAGMFDVPLAEKAERTLYFDSPPLEQSWSIGCIVGPSGSGKSAIARHLFGQNYYTSGDWNSKQAVIDSLADSLSSDLPIKEITRMLTIVGFSSPPSWIKPYSVLSNGEKFRCDLARALLDGNRNQGLVVFDEYTSVVDRTVAKIASAALAKAMRRDGRLQTANGGRGAAPILLPSVVCCPPSPMPSQFVAVTCHYDILDWLEPDWILDTATGELTALPCEAQKKNGDPPSTWKSSVADVLFGKCLRRITI